MKVFVELLFCPALEHGHYDYYEVVLYSDHPSVDGARDHALGSLRVERGGLYLYDTKDLLVGWVAHENDLSGAVRFMTVMGSVAFQ